MPFRNPFSRIKEINDQNYLSVSLANFLEIDGKPAQFYDAIRELQRIREGLRVAEQIGRIGELPGRQYYMEGLRWLALNSPVSNGVAVSQISSYDDINDAIANSFFQFVIWLRDSQFGNQSLYQQIQVQLGINKVDRLEKLDLSVEKLQVEFEDKLLSSQKELSEAVNRQRTSLEDSLTQHFTHQINQVEVEGQNAVSKIQQAQSLETWREYYQANVSLYESKLSGRVWHSLNLGGRWMNVRQQWSGRLHNYATNRPRNSRYLYWRYLFSRLLNFVWYTLYRSVRLLIVAVGEVLIYLFSKLFSIKGRRLMWFTLLAGVLIAQAIVIFFVATDPHVSSEFAMRIQKLLSKDFLGAKISAFLGFVLIPSLGYASSNRNYRIYSNLLEQYRHRATVAQTLQGVLRNIAEGDDNKDIRQSLAAVAAVSMFELKTIGHLTKGSDTSLPLAEIFQGIFGSSR